MIILFFLLKLKIAQLRVKKKKTFVMDGVSKMW